MKNKKTIMSVMFLLVGLGGLHAQENTIATGGKATGTVRTPPSIGDFRDGGIVFWLDGSGGGLVCTVSDQGTGVQWYNGSFTGTDVKAYGKGIGTGQANTTSIVTSQGTGNYAAQLCDDLVENGYSDWFLPSINELTEIYNNVTAINITASANGGTVLPGMHNNRPYGRYWSSTEDGSNDAWTYLCGFNKPFPMSKNFPYRVRAVRAF